MAISPQPNKKEVDMSSIEDGELMTISPQPNKKRRLEVDVVEWGHSTRQEVENANLNEVSVQLCFELTGSPGSRSPYDGWSGEVESTLQGGRSGLESGSHVVSSPPQPAASSKRKRFYVGGAHPRHGPKIGVVHNDKGF